MRFSPQFLDELRAPPSGIGGGGPARDAQEGRGANGKGCRRSTRRRRRRSSSTTRRGVVLIFSSGKHGFDLRLRHATTEGLAFPEAVGAAGRSKRACRCRRFPRKTRRARTQRKTLHDVMETCGEVLRGFARVACRRRGARLSRRPRPRSRRRSSTFRIGYAPGERSALKEHLGKEGVSGRGHDRVRPADRAATTSRCPMTASATG